MRPSLTDIRQSEKYLRGSMEQDECALFEARLLTDQSLRANLHFLQKTFSLLRIYNRKQLKQEVAAVHERIFTDPSKAVFQQNIRRQFKR